MIYTEKMSKDLEVLLENFKKSNLRYRAKDPIVREAQRALVFGKLLSTKESERTEACDEHKAHYEHEETHVKHETLDESMSFKSADTLKDEIPAYLRDEPPAHAKIFTAYPKSIPERISDALSKSYKDIINVVGAFKNSSKIIKEFYQSLPEEDKNFINYIAKNVGHHHLVKLSMSAFGLTSASHLIALTLLAQFGIAEATADTNSNPFQFIDGFPPNGIDRCYDTSNLAISCKQFYVTYQGSPICQAIGKLRYQDFGGCDSYTPSCGITGCTPNMGQFKNYFSHILSGLNFTLPSDTLAPNAINTIFSNGMGWDGTCDGKDFSDVTISSFIEIFGINSTSPLVSALQNKYPDYTSQARALSCDVVDCNPDSYPLAWLGITVSVLAGVAWIACLTWIGRRKRGDAIAENSRREEERQRERERAERERERTERNREREMERKKEAESRREAENKLLEESIRKEIKELSPDFPLTPSGKGTTESKTAAEVKHGKIDKKYQEILKKIAKLVKQQCQPKLIQELNARVTLAYYSWDNLTNASLLPEKRIAEIKEIIKKVNADIYLDLNIKNQYLSLLATVCIDRGTVHHSSNFKVAQGYYLCAYTAGLHIGDSETASSALHFAFRPEEALAKCLDHKQLERELFLKEKDNFKLLVDAYNSNCQELGLSSLMHLDRIAELPQDLVSDGLGLEDSKDAGGLQGLDAEDAADALDTSIERSEGGFVVIHIDRDDKDNSPESGVRFNF